MKSANGIRRVALIGSLFAVGPDIEPMIEPVAGRSGNNYGEIVARRLGAAIADLAVSGATTDTCCPPCSESVDADSHRNFRRSRRTLT